MAEKQSDSNKVERTQEPLNKGSLKEKFETYSEQMIGEILYRASEAMPCNMNQADKDKLVTRSIYEMNPQDPVEAKLCAKEASLYSLAMKYLHRAEIGMFSEESDMGSRMWYETIMNFGLKLLRVHNETVETLNRYKRRGEQKVVVQHQYGVQVNDGGQAIVNNQVAVGGEGVITKMKEEAHGSSEIMRSEIEDKSSPTLSVEGVAKREVQVPRRSQHRTKGSRKTTPS